MTPLSSSYNILGLVAGMLVTLSMLLTETSEIQKVCFFGSCPGINVLTEQWKQSEFYRITCIYTMPRIVYSNFFRFRHIHR